MILQKRGQQIATIDDWRRLAPPKDPVKHWVDGRSAKECAIAWLAAPGSFPDEIVTLLRSNSHVGELTIERIEPEALLPFDDRHGPRNADVAVWARDISGAVAISVEAKADEPFDLPVVDVFSHSLERLLENPRSGGVARIVDLVQSLFAAKRKGDRHVGDLRYQLIAATAGTLAFAKLIGASRAIVIVQELVTSATSVSRLALNATDFAAFVRRLSNGTVTEVTDGMLYGMLYGPFTVPGEPLFAQPASVFIGKAVRTLGKPGE